jgi:CubicO group peptidase (beta-lactamase class C family)
MQALPESQQPTGPASSEVGAGISGPSSPYGDRLLRASPSSQGVDADGVAAWLDDIAAAGLDLHAFMLHRHGHVVAEGWRWPYRADRPRNLHSVAKSFTACAVGLALEAGHFRLDDRVVSFFPEAPTDPYHPLASMTVADLLTMRTGHAGETSGAVWRQLEGSWVEAFFRIPVDHPPGSKFVYTSAASYMLSAIVSRTTGETLHDYLRPRLFEPLGIVGETWDIGPDGINPGGNGLIARTADLLKLGVLHAQDGVWEGRRLLPEHWVRDATHAQEASGRYGYHWWVHEDGGYSAIGKFVQMVRVFPEHGATLAVTGAMKGSKLLMPHIDRHFPKCFAARPFDGHECDARLAEKLDQWQAADAPTPWRRAFDSAPDAWDAGAGIEAPATIWRFALDPNDAGASELRLTFSADRCEFALADTQGAHPIAAGFGHWVEGVTDMPGAELHHGYRFRDSPVVARAAWVDPKRLRIMWIYPETAFRDMVECAFDGDVVVISRSVNINSGLTAQNDLTGRRFGS